MTLYSLVAVAALLLEFSPLLRATLAYLFLELLYLRIDPQWRTLGINAAVFLSLQHPRQNSERMSTNVLWIRSWRQKC